MTTLIRWIVLATAVLAGTMLAGCTGGGHGTGSSAPEVVDRTFALAPASAVVSTPLLAGRVVDLQVFERVEKGTGRIVDAPRLQGKLRLRNVSSDHAIRPLGGQIDYVDGSGTPIPLAKDRQDTSFKFSTWQVERLDPGMDAIYDVDVPFPIAGLTARSLADVRLAITYTEVPYHRDVVVMPLSLTAKSASAQ